MNDEFVVLTEKEYMWTEMLMEVLRDNDIPCLSKAVYGAGLTMKTGRQEFYQIFVPTDKLAEATDLLNQLFAGDFEE